VSHDREIADNRKPWDAWTPIHTAGDFYRAARFRDEKRSSTGRRRS